jgi:hypothetical protein
MKVAINSEGTGTLGGTEFCIALLAEAFRRSHDVEIVSHRMETTLDEWSSKFGRDLEGVKLR